PFRRWLQRHLQGWLFWPLSSFLTWSMRYSSIAFVARTARWERSWLVDVVCLALHYTVWLVLPSLAWGVLPVLGFYALLWGIVGVYLTAIFAPAHFGLPLYAAHEDAWR